MIPAVSSACTVVKVRWPVVAAVRAACISTDFLTSPIRMMLGCCRIADEIALSNEYVSRPTSRWMKSEPFAFSLLLSNRYSIGRSMVMIVGPVGLPLASGR